MLQSAFVAQNTSNVESEREIPVRYYAMSLHVYWNAEQILPLHKNIKFMFKY